MKHILRRLWVLFGVAAMVAILVAPLSAAADPYGHGSYGNCPYARCEPTQVILPSGLKVSINLTDGQVIPRTGYTITITPLNGQGSSFKQAAFYIHSQLAGTALPDGTGTAQWFWDPLAYEGTDIRIIVTDTDGTETAHAFAVSIAKESATGAPTPAGQHTSAAPRATGIAAMLDFAANGLNKLSQGAIKTIQALPKPIAYGFPYILFGLLAANALLLLYQMQREVREYHILRSLLAHQKIIAESKKTLMELVSHYLRTPITIVLGGIDMVPKDSRTAVAVHSLQQVAMGIGTNIEGLITDTRTASEIALSGRGDTALSATALWRQPGLFVPVLLILVILIPYNYLAHHGGALNITEVNITIQFITFLAVVTVMYVVFRQLHLHRRDQQEIRRLQSAQAATGRTRDELVTSTVAVLRTDLAKIDALVTQLPASQATHFIAEGQKRFHDILTKCTIAASLRGSHSSAPYARTTLSTLATSTKKQLASKLQGRQLTIADGTAALTMQDPGLIAHVIYTVVDNALTYSPTGSPVTIRATTTDGGTDIIISDQGKGMPAAKVSQLFQPFFKIEGAETFNHEGMGFNLYLDKVIMEYLGGTISLVSQKSHGTTVTLHVPEIR